MYEIVMSTGDRAECDTISACLTCAATLAEDVGWRDDQDRRVTVRWVNLEAIERIGRSDSLDSKLRAVLNQHLSEVRPS